MDSDGVVQLITGSRQFDFSMHCNRTARVLRCIGHLAVDATESNMHRF